MYGINQEKIEILATNHSIGQVHSNNEVVSKMWEKHSIGLDERTYSCECGYQEDRDVHSAMNMITIKNLVFSKLNLVPTEHREVTLMEFKTSVNNTGSIVNKLEQ